MDDPSAWLAEDFRGNEESFIYHFTEQDLKEVEAAIAKVEAKGLRIEVWLTHLHCFVHFHWAILLYLVLFMTRPNQDCLLSVLSISHAVWLHSKLHHPGFLSLCHLVG